MLAEFAACPDRPVPALADPCDVTRAHDDFSRVAESTRITVRAERPGSWRPYRRVRVLLGLAPADGGGDTDPEALAAVREIAKAPPDQRPGVLLHWFRRLAARDAMDAEPGREPGDVCLPPFPVTEDDAAVVLARLTAEVTDHGDGCVDIGPVAVDSYVRTTILPTATVQELACGLASGLLGVETRPDAGAPRPVPGSMRWSRGSTRLVFQVTAPLAPGSQESAIEISSLSDRGHGWSAGNVERVRLEDGGRVVVVELDDAPAYETVRVLIRDTGPTPLLGRSPRVPFAGVEGGPPGTPDGGHDAVVTMQLESGGYRESGNEAGRAES
ncbi:hypothetical protein [Frankia sp. Cas4]|uniref:hypothetical protein n=1 Tax=Frankia sp. Cas4 TaxID=3073927 RepID=UPI002AD1D8D0|nr:hypothetical protein [Frankia sp. Cas4]